MIPPTPAGSPVSAVAWSDLQLQQVPDNLLRNETFLADGVSLPHHRLTDATILEPPQLRFLPPEGPEVQGLRGDIGQDRSGTWVTAGAR